MTPDFNPLMLLTNEAGVTFCMMTPTFLAVLTLFFPLVNRAVLRVTSFVGILLGLRGRTEQQPQKDEGRCNWKHGPHMRNSTTQSIRAATGSSLAKAGWKRNFRQ